MRGSSDEGCSKPSDNRFYISMATDSNDRSLQMTSQDMPIMAAGYQETCSASTSHYRIMDETIPEQVSTGKYLWFR